MASLNLSHESVFTSGADPITIGNKVPVTISSLTNVHSSRYTLATATNKILLNLGSASTDDLNDFDYLIILSDQDLLLEIMGTTQADNSNVRIKANVPYIMGYSTTLAYDASGVFAGASQNITKLTCRNNSGSTANILVLAVT